jgi:hypothetical protein
MTVKRSVCFQDAMVESGCRLLVNVEIKYAYFMGG